MLKSNLTTLVLSLFLGLTFFLSSCSEDAATVAVPESIPAEVTSVQPQHDCEPDSELAVFCDFENPEDLALTPDNKFLIVTGFHGKLIVHEVHTARGKQPAYSENKNDNDWKFRPTEIHESLLT